LTSKLNWKLQTSPFVGGQRDHVPSWAFLSLDDNIVNTELMPRVICWAIFPIPKFAKGYNSKVIVPFPSKNDSKIAIPDLLPKSHKRQISLPIQYMKRALKSQISYTL
jgi:hypothetical protein